MGNICGSSRCLKHGFFRSIWHSLWGSRSPDLIQYEKRKARNHHRHAKNHKVTRPVQNTPPNVVSIAQEDPKLAQPVTKEHGKQSGKVVIVKQQSKPTQKNVQNSVNYAQHKRRKSSAGLLVDKVLKTRSGFLKDHYTIGLKLGQGQFGTTSTCINKKTGKLYACKSISKRKLVTDDDVEDVRREVEIMHHLSGHPNVVSIEGAYEDAYEVHLVMELCGGGELYERIAQKGHYSERKAADLLRTIASVIEACHSLGVVHRDLKPENFLFVDKGEDSPLKAIDFGLSAFFKPGEVFTDILGSPYYVAPEVLLKHYGSEVDIWSAGVILYVLLSGNDVFREILEGEIDFSFDPWPVISTSAKDLIKKMLLRDRGRRITAHEILRHPWISVDGVAPDKPLDPAVLTRLSQFSAMNKLKKMALKVIASKLSEEEIAGLKQMFKMIDTDKSGYITFQELKDGLKSFGAVLDESDIYDLMQSADINNSGTIDYDEFVAATLHFTKVDREDRLFAAFSYFDKDGSGYITRNELQQACKEFGIDVIHLGEIIKEVDQNNDGRIDYNAIFIAAFEFKGRIFVTPFYTREMESGNGVHGEDENGVENNVVSQENSNEVESSRLEVSESSEDVNGSKIPNSVEVAADEGTSKTNKVTKNGPKGSPLACKPKAHLTQNLSFPAKPRNHDAMRSSMDGHPTKPRATLSNANGTNPANRRASTGMKTKESGPNARVTRPVKPNGSKDGPPSADPLSVAPGGQHKNSVVGFSSRLEERAEKRKEFFSKIEEKIHAKEAEKTNLQEKSKENQEAEIKQLRKTLMFKAAPMPKFYKEPPPKVDLKKIPTTRPKSPKLGRNKSNMAAATNGSAVSPHVTRSKTSSHDVNATNGDKDTTGTKKAVRKSQTKAPSSKTEVKSEKSKEECVQEEEKECNEQSSESPSPNPLEVEG
ncbi:hypothetical protein L1987_25444 [Smallanthus sonchifolius]|uniref:Uncharacterized protein n=1 Tax=Smallanthus sonchifolius TaxID=185202 RepID=A0ACB9IMJ8_9ASTR|nr:hypothetical protein L1987_25444 [Smallanthus sonchifolius]